MKDRRPGWRIYSNKLLALEISSMSRYYDRLVQHARVPGDDGLLFELVECPSKSSDEEADALPDMSSERDRRSMVLLNGTFNHSWDIQGLLAGMKPRLSPTSRVTAVVYNPYFGGLYRLARRLGLRSGEAPTTFITVTDLTNIGRLSGYRIVRIRSAVYVPFKLAGIGSLINAFMPAIPLLRHLSLAAIVVLAPVADEDAEHSVSVVIPARNERGNIEAALEGLRAVKDELPGLEVILVEGHSSDGTWEEIQRLAPIYLDFFKVVALQQQGRGKGDAVRLGFSRATGDLLTILDADLTVSPALLGRFYEAYRRGHGELVNGSRLVYASESQAMRFLNSIGNVVFAKFLSYVLSVRLGDSLCGTKLLARHDYARFTAWRNGFGDFDPFGDFELLFPAAVLGLTVVDVPIRYGARNYGTTNISRFTHGWMLLKMTIIGFFRVRLGKV
jgi:hypothetical protein